MVVEHGGGSPGTGENDDDIKAFAAEARRAIIKYATNDWIQHSPFLVRGSESTQQDAEQRSTVLAAQTTTVAPPDVSANPPVKEMAIDTQRDNLKKRVRVCAYHLRNSSNIDVFTVQIM